MSNYNFGIECELEKTAEDLLTYIETLDLYSDSLDIFESRVSLVSKNTLLDGLLKFAEKQKALLQIELWPENLEYDDAESRGVVETKVFDFKPKSKSTGKIKILNFKVYAGDEAVINRVGTWITNGQFENLAVVSKWEPEDEFGTWGIEFTYSDPKIPKTIKAEWLKNGVICELVK